MFRRFGELRSVTISPAQDSALIVYKHFMSSYVAQQSVNNHYLSKYGALLLIKWLPKNLVAQYEEEFGMTRSAEQTSDATSFKSESPQK